MSKGWKNLQNLQIEIIDPTVLVTKDGFKGFEDSTKLRQITIKAHVQWNEDDDVIWQLDIFEANKDLDFIRLIDLTKNFDFGTNKLVQFKLHNVKAKLEYGEVRADFRKLYDKYPPWFELDTEKINALDAKQSEEISEVDIGSDGVLELDSCMPAFDTTVGSEGSSEESTE